MYYLWPVYLSPKDLPYFWKFDIDMGHYSYIVTIEAHKLMYAHMDTINIWNTFVLLSCYIHLYFVSIVHAK